MRAPKSRAISRISSDCASVLTSPLSVEASRMLSARDGGDQVLLEIAADFLFEDGHAGVDGAAERRKAQDAGCDKREIVAAADGGRGHDLLHAGPKGHGQQQRGGQRAAQLGAVAHKLVHVFAKDHPGPAPQFTRLVAGRRVRCTDAVGGTRLRAFSLRWLVLLPLGTTL